MEHSEEFKSNLETFANCINAFFAYLCEGMIGELMEGLSPNFRQLIEEEHCAERYHKIFVDGQQVVATVIWGPNENEPGFLSGTVAVRSIPTDALESGLTVDRNGILQYRANEKELIEEIYDVCLINLKGVWLIDEIHEVEDDERRNAFLNAIT